MLGRLLNSGQLGLLREETNDFSKAYFISFPADLHLTSVLTLRRPDERAKSVRRISATPFRQRASSNRWGDEEGGELEFHINHWDGDFLKPRHEGLKTGIYMDAVKREGMREHWGGTVTRKAGDILSDLGRKEGFPSFIVNHGASYTLVKAKLRNVKQAQQEFQVWLDMLEERGVILPELVK